MKNVYKGPFLDYDFFIWRILESAMATQAIYTVSGMCLLKRNLQLVMVKPDQVERSRHTV